MISTVLEIGSGSFKLHKEGAFSKRYQSSLGKNLGSNGALDAGSLQRAFKSVEEEIIPFLKDHGIKLDGVLVFATAAIRAAVHDPQGSGQAFIEQMESYGFRDIRVFSEDDESRYGAMGVLDGLSNPPANCAILDTGGASHQLIEISNGQISKMVSKPIGSHADLSKVKMPDFHQEGFSKQKEIILIGTSGKILNSIPGINYDELLKVKEYLAARDVYGRRELLESLIPDRDIHKLFVDYRLEIMPNSFELIANCARSLGVTNFLGSDHAAKNYVSKYGFSLH